VGCQQVKLLSSYVVTLLLGELKSQVTAQYCSSIKEGCCGRCWMLSCKGWWLAMFWNNTSECCLVKEARDSWWNVHSSSSSSSSSSSRRCESPAGLPRNICQ
jgi:hypothetical protein